MRLLSHARRAALSLAVLAAAGSLGACDDMLSVQNPAAIGEGNLSDPGMRATVVASAVGEFNRMYNDMAYWGAILGDEAVTGHNFFQIQDFDLRVVDDHNAQLDEVYNPVQRARGLAEDIVARLRTAMGDSAKSDVGFARALTYAGLGNVVLGEYFCTAPVEPTGEALSSDDVLKRALVFFDEAIEVATAAKAANAKVAADANQVINLARVAAGRAALQVGDEQKAIAYASAVPASFVQMLGHSDTKSFLENPLYGATTGTNHNFGVDVAFRNLNDPRVRHRTVGRTGHNQLTILYTPYQSESYSDWTTKDSVAFTKTAALRIASGLEARYIVAEAGGMDDAALRAFIDERRAIGNQGPFTGTDLKAELRDQRRRDFFIDGHRLGDLRRYKKLYGVDEFPQGQHPNASWGSYGTAECYVPYFSEWIGFPRK